MAVYLGGCLIVPWQPRQPPALTTAPPVASSLLMGARPVRPVPAAPWALPSATSARALGVSTLMLGGRPIVPWRPPSPVDVAATRAAAPAQASGGAMRRAPGAAAAARRAADGPALRPSSSTGRAVASQEDRGWFNPTRDLILAALKAPTSATHLGQVIQQERAIRSVSGPNRTAWNDYLRVCATRNEESLPITAATLLALAADYVGTRGNQAKGVSSLLSRVKSYAQSTGLWHVSHEDEDRLRKDASFLCAQFPYEVRAAEPITFVELDKALAWLALQERTLWTLQMAAMMTVMHGGLLRGSEAAEGHLLVKDAVRVAASADEGRGGYKLLLAWRKMNKKVNDARVDNTCIVARTSPNRCPVLALDSFLAAAGLSPASPLFVTRDRASGAVTDASGISYDTLTKEVKYIFSQAGVKNAYSFTARGFRSGGHTDLYREAKDFELVGLLGGWRSVESQRLYLRMERLSFRHLSEVLE